MLTEAAGAPWRPERLIRAGLQVDDRLRYVVVEEVVDGISVLHVWPWPRADRKGRLSWATDEQGPVELTVLVEQLRDQLYRGQLRRQPRCGDTFAGVLRDRAQDAEARLVADLRPLFPDGLWDVSADAHAAAKLAYQGALADVEPPPAGEHAQRLPDRGRAPRLVLAAPRRDHRGGASR